MAIQGPNVLTQGTMTIDVLDNNGIISNVLDGSLPWNVNLKWSVTNGAGFIIPPMQWRLRVYVESLGTGIEAMVGEANVAVVHPNPAAGYSNMLTVAPPIGSSTPGAPDPSGVYRVVGVLTLYTTIAGAVTPLPLAGFVEGPVIQFMLP